jgi:hypothetical protein
LYYYQVGLLVHARYHLHLPSFSYLSQVEDYGGRRMFQSMSSWRR